MLVRGFVVAGLAAGFAVQQAVSAKTNLDHGLAEAAEFFALARTFELFALRTVILGGAGSGAHTSNVARVGRPQEMTLVMPSVLERAHATATRRFSVAYNSEQ